MRRVLVLGATGMLGHVLFRELSLLPGHQVWGTLRGEAARHHFPAAAQPWLLSGVDVLDQDALVQALARIRPQVLINCVGLIKHHRAAADPLRALPLNALLPHRLARLCEACGARLIHISSDCVFAGNRGDYHEDDPPDALDLYGRSKALGEPGAAPHVLTLRTSIIGHELETRHALVEWFLSRRQGEADNRGEPATVDGYARAVFSGLPTVELATVIGRHVLPVPALHGVYHVAAQAIDKYSLLRLIAQVYGCNINVRRDDRVMPDRSLDGARFNAASGYEAPSWPQLIRRMQSAR